MRGDTRGRVPFALVGVLLLVGATTYGSTVALQGPATADRRVDATLERVDVAGAAALRSAVTRAAEAAAARPVVEPADTRYGRVVADGDPFRRYLRLRVYLATRRSLAAADVHTAGVDATASLPAVRSPQDARDAIGRVAVASVANGTALRVTVDDVTVTARRDGRVVAREVQPVGVTVSTPVLAMHDRTRQYERRLDRGALAGPGLGRRLTARLYPVVWARGYAQYGGVPVENVLTNRHVELSTNGAVLRLQRSVFGRSDPAGRRALRRATVRTGVRDLVGVAQNAGVPASTPPNGTAGNASGRAAPGVGWASAVVPAADDPVGRSTAIARATDGGNATDREFRVGVNETADRALAGLLSGRNGEPLSSVLDRVYTAEARLVTRVDQRRDGSRPAPSDPGGGWQLLDTTVESNARAAPGSARVPTAPADFQVLRVEGRRVTVTHHVTWTWVDNGTTTRTRDSWTDTYAVGVAVAGRPVPLRHGPDAPVHPPFVRGGALDGPNFAGVPPEAWDRLVAARGGADGVAVEAATGTVDEATATVDGRMPPGLREWVRTDLERLHGRVRQRSVTVAASGAATGAARPHRRLAVNLSGHRARVVDAPASGYDGVADRARVEARAAYLDRVLDGLHGAAADQMQLRDGFEDALGGVGTSRARLGDLLEASRSVETPDARPVDAGGGPGDDVQLVPDGGPPYLTLAPVGDDRVPALDSDRAYRPLVARNINLFTMPHGDVADGVVESVTGRPDRVRLATAAQVLVAANRTLERDAESRPRVRERRAVLRQDVEGSMQVVTRRLVTVLGRETELSLRTRKVAVAAAVGRWNGTGRRALAATNGSLAPAVAAAAVDRGADTEPAQLGRRLRVELAALESDRATWVAQPRVSSAEQVVRTVARDHLRSFVENRTAAAAAAARERWFGETVASVAAGLPVLPSPGYWYATVNVWTVEVRGAYPRFVVRAPTGAPDGPGAAARYVRENATVRLDVDGDGSDEVLGGNRRVAFRSGTVVTVAVPPGKSGVGDVDGQAEERSGGWPTPGCTGTGDCRRERQANASRAGAEPAAER